MFDSDVGELDSGAALAAAADLRALTDRAESRLLQVAAHWADLNGPDDFEDRLSGSGDERYLVYGGDGCPEVGEFACAELGAALGTSSRGAAGLISDALGLRHRMPRLWAGVLAGRVAPWRARRIVHACVTVSRAAARIVDAQVAGIANRVGPWRLRRIIEAAIVAVDPEQAQANADAMARERGVWVGRSDSYGTKRMSIKAAAGDIARLDARIDQVADILAELGDTDGKDLRRAKAIGWLADPESALELLIHAQTTNSTNHTWISGHGTSVLPAEAVLAAMAPLTSAPAMTAVTITRALILIAGPRAPVRRMRWVVTGTPLATTSTNSAALPAHRGDLAAADLGRWLSCVSPARAAETAYA